jgi:tRNA-2-methylthio-N6-dimethylallyladenosine synthase
MNRTYTNEEFLLLVDKIRIKIPGVAVTTDIIVGFPTETDGEFEDTLQVVSKVGFDSAFTFKYSERQGTIASKKYHDDVPEAIKTERIMRLNEIQKEITYQKNRAHIGDIQTVLLEPYPEAQNTQIMPGRTDGNKLVLLPKGSYKGGEMVNARITDATPHALKGLPV